MKNFPNLPSTTDNDWPLFEETLKETLKAGDFIGLSIDLETPIKGTMLHTGIFSVGIVPFNMDTGEIYEELSFYSRFDFCEVVDQESVQGSTLRWWMQQSEEARLELINKKRTPDLERKRYVDIPCDSYLGGLCKTQNYLNAIGRRVKEVYPLGNGKEFDVTLLQNTFAKHSLITEENDQFVGIPWKFWQACDLRQRILDTADFTGKNVKEIKQSVKREGVHHNAVDDAMHQAKLYVHCGVLHDEFVQEQIQMGIDAALAVKENGNES